MFVTNNSICVSQKLQAQVLTELAQLISEPRMKSYKVLTSGDSMAANLGAYLWNKQASAALYPLMQCLEVTLRNAVHNAASNYFETPDWFDRVTKSAGDDMFIAYMKKYPDKRDRFYRNGVSTGQRKGKKIWTSHHENMIATAKEKLKNCGKRQAADAVIAELTFGFWSGIFENNYNDIRSASRLWPHLEPTVFPNLKPADRKASTVLYQLKSIKDLRNRMAHYEPIWKHSSVNNASSALSYLNNSIDQIVALIRGISHERANLLQVSGIESFARNLCQEELLESYISAY
ncbi:Abi family protein [Pseudescherichia sp.]|uniref:Abi family protein n=1 Tax=Pseudescherichia sp. TaxID=2055881 RepID=UPI00289CA885|nr:Abi family protein [Pseudescherichia sp.]